MVVEWDLVRQARASSHVLGAGIRCCDHAPTTAGLE